ncbi:hypothetical protein [Cupriavidus sp. CP313]
MTEIKRSIPIKDAKTGEVLRYGEAPPQRGTGNARQGIASMPAGSSMVSASTADTTDASAASAPTSLQNPEQSTSVSSRATGERRTLAKQKVEIETLVQFITSAYGLRGRKVSLKPRVERLIAQHPKLMEVELERLMALAKGDATLAVPRQLLLVARSIQTYPALRAEIRAFVRRVLLSHPILMQRGIEEAIRNVDEAPGTAEALKILAGTEQKLLTVDQAEPMKATEFEQLRTNAVYCLALWLVDIKGLSVDAITDALYLALWRPRGSRLEDDTARLRALTEIEAFEGVGLACHEYRKQAADKHAQAESFAREDASLREQVGVLESELSETRKKVEALELANAALITSHDEALNAQKAAADMEAVHLRDDLELLRTRVLRRLTADVDLLELGLEALRRPEPKVHVMVDSAERVADALRREIQNLQGS